MVTRGNASRKNICTFLKDTQCHERYWTGTVLDFHPVKDSFFLNFSISDGNGTEKVLNKPLVIVVEGSLKSSMTLHKPWLKHVVILSNSPGVDGTSIKVGIVHI